MLDFRTLQAYIVTEKRDENTGEAIMDVDAAEQGLEVLVLDGDTSLLVVDDDKPFLTRLARAMETRGFQVDTAESVEEAVSKVRAHAPAYAVVDMRLGDGNGLDVVAAIRETREDTRTVILTGYGNIATAVAIAP